MSCKGMPVNASGKYQADVPMPCPGCLTELMVPDVFGCQPRHSHILRLLMLPLIANPKLLEEAFDYNLCHTLCV